MNFDFETRDHYDKAAHDVAYLKRLDEYALNRVSDWAEEIWAEDVRQATMLTDANTTYAYPDEYRGGREVEYWLSIEYQAQKCAKVRKAIEQIRNPAPPPPPPLTTSRAIPDETLNQWLLEAVNYESFIETLTKYQLEVLDSHALRYQLRIYDEYIPADMTFGTDEGRAEFGKRSKKLSTETYYENVIELRQRLKALLKPEAVVTDMAQAGKYVPPPTPQTFAELFHDPASLAPCLDALRLIDPPVLSETGNWIGKRGSKSILVAWIEVLEQRGKLKPIPNRAAFAPLLNQQFPGLNLEPTASIFGKPTYKRSDYQAEFMRLIPA